MRIVETVYDEGDEKQEKREQEEILRAANSKDTLGRLGGLSVVQTVGGFSGIVIFSERGHTLEITTSPTDESSSYNTYTRHIV